MVNYLIMRIKDGKLLYENVILKYPQFKDKIDEALA